MKYQFRRGRFKYISFILLDLVSLAVSILISLQLYLRFGNRPFHQSEYSTVISYMFVIDIAVTLLFNTLDGVLRRRKRNEVVESGKHVVISFFILALLLFSIKQGAEFSRVTIYLIYAFYLILMIISRIAWKELLKINRSERKIPTAMLVTTVGYAREGLSVVENAGMSVKGMFITDKTNEGVIRDIPIIVDRDDAAAFMCWEWIDKVYICGPENIDIPESLLHACKQMGISVFSAPARKSFDYEIVKIRTALQENDKTTGLSFFESEHDIPFQIRRFYSIFESEQNNQKGFHAHKQSWHLLFCPYGTIDVMIDTGRERKTISMSDPSVGLILHPSVWREIFWKKPGSVLCVAASGHYDSNKLRTDYTEYQKFLQEKEWSATLQSAEIMGG